MRSTLHYITEEDGRSLSVQNGVVTQSSQPKPLPNAPAGAKEVVISWERILNRYGIQRMFTTPLQYVLDGARIIRHFVYTKNYEHRLFHLIQRVKSTVTDTLFRLRYEYLYRGEIDLSTFADQGDYVTCNIMEGGLDKQLRAKETTVYEIPFDDDAVLVRMDGIPIFSRSSLVSPEQTHLTNVTTYSLLWLALEFINVEGTIVNGATLSAIQMNHQATSSHDDNRNLDNFFFEATAEIRIKIKFPAFSGILNNGLSAELYIKKSDGTRIQIHEVETDNPSITTGFQKIQEFPEKEVTVSLNTGEKLYLISELIDSGLIAGGSAVTWTEFIPVIEFDSIHRTTYIQAFRPFDLYRKLVEKITGDADNASSELLQAEANLLLTSGDSVRGIEGASIKTSLADFYQHCNVVHFAGQAIEGEKAVVEHRSHFFDTSNPIDLGNATNLKTTLATDLIGNTLKVGWQEPEIEDLNGKYSFNGNHIYESVITRIPKELSLVSPYSADPYEIEIKRLNLEGKTSTDDKADNKVYCINAIRMLDRYESSGIVFNASGDVYSIEGVPSAFPIYPGMKIVTLDPLNAGPFTIKERFDSEPTKVTLIVEEPVTTAPATFVVFVIYAGVPYILKRENYDILEGVPTNQVFNIEDMSPKRILKKQGPWLRSILYPHDNSSLDFASTQRNKDLITQRAGLTIEEKANVAINSLGERLFLPFYFEFETEIPQNIIDIMEENPNRCFVFTWKGQQYKGFTVKVSIAINTEESQTIKLLCAPDVDITKLEF